MAIFFICVYILSIDLCLTIVYTYARQMKGGKLLSAKMGRPTTNPRPHKISIRINDESKEILEKYCKQKAMNKTAAIECGIAKLKAEIKE